ncbi:MAG: MipA/OmpV family protein [Acidiferrobacterales bacterium]|nr:MipA/OmpV family protein [Acidiferrobacterales bacterium]
MKIVLAAFTSAVVFTASAAQAERLPVYELGIGPGAIYQNYYLGTKDTRSFAFPAIVPIYRGETFKSDEEGARAQLFKDDKYKLDLSVDFNLAIDSEDIRLREGMPDIDSVLQIGPSLQITLDKNADREWRIRLPLRFGSTIGSDFETAGFTFSPDITYLRDLHFAGSPWRLGLSAGPQLGTSDYHAVYYGVDEAFVTADREAYDPDGGLTGYRFLATFTSKTPKRITSWFLRYENLSGAAIEDSPLVEQSDGWTVGFIYSVLLFKSKKLVEVE